MKMIIRNIKRKNKINICVTSDPTKDHRTMYEKPEFDFGTDILDKRLSTIPYIDFLYKYVYDNKLEGSTIKFTIYDKLVRKKKK